MWDLLLWHAAQGHNWPATPSPADRNGRNEADRVARRHAEQKGAQGARQGDGSDNTNRDSGTAERQNLAQDRP